MIETRIKLNNNLEEALKLADDLTKIANLYRNAKAIESCEKDLIGTRVISYDVSQYGGGYECIVTAINKRVIDYANSAVESDDNPEEDEW